MEEETKQSKIYGLRVTANREDQVMDFIVANAQRKKLEVYAVIRPHGMRGYIFLEAGNRTDAEQAALLKALTHILVELHLPRCSHPLLSARSSSSIAYRLPETAWP